MHKLSRAPNPSTCTQDRINAPHGVESGGLNYPYDLYIVDANGKHIRNLTHDYPTNYLIDRLPDGRILYESVPNDRMRTGRSRIFSINADGTGRRQLASGTGELLPKLSPDGHRILFARGRWLYVMWSDGTHKRRLVQMSFGHYENPTPHVPYDASWSPEGGSHSCAVSRSKMRTADRGILSPPYT
jgi:hypothetical protein